MEKGTDHTEGINVMSDLIERQAAIDVALNFFVEYLSGAFHEDSQEELIGIFQRMPSAQPKSIQCKDCKYHRYDNNKIPYCINIDYGYGWKDDDFCSRAERREDG